MKCALIRVLRKPEGGGGRGGGERERPAVVYERGRVSGLVRRLAAGGASVGLGRKARSESPSPGGQGDSKSHDTRASLTHYQRVWGTSRFDAESLLEKQLMECLECALLEWGPSPPSLPRVAKRMSTGVLLSTLADRPLSRPFANLWPPYLAKLGEPRALRVLSAIDHIRNVGAISIHLWAQQDFLGEREMKYRSMYGSINVKKTI